MRSARIFPRGGPAFTKLATSTFGEKMKSVVPVRALLALLLGLSLFTSSRASSQTRFIDVPGKAYLLRDGQKAALVILGDAAKKLDDTVKPSAASPITCGKGYCVLAQFTRDGQMESATGEFARSEYYSKFIARRAKPNGLAEQFWYEKYGSKASAWDNQCQEIDRRQKDSTILRVEGIAAERLFNFENKAGKAAHCVKGRELDPDDLGPTGEVFPDSPISHSEYFCEFDISPVGEFNEKTECRIYGASSSAGGGGGK